MQDLLNRITFNKDVLCGKPLIRGLRISVEIEFKEGENFNHRNI